MNLPKVVIFMSVKDVVLAVLFGNYGKRYRCIVEHACAMRSKGIDPMAGKLGRLRVDLAAAQRDTIVVWPYTKSHVKNVCKVVKLLELTENESAKKANLTAEQAQQALLSAEGAVNALLDVQKSEDPEILTTISAGVAVSTALKQLARGEMSSAKDYAAAYDMAYETECWANRRREILRFRDDWLLKMHERSDRLPPEQLEGLRMLEQMSLSEWLDGKATLVMQKTGLVTQ